MQRFTDPRLASLPPLSVDPGGGFVGGRWAVALLAALLVLGSSVISVAAAQQHAAERIPVDVAVFEYPPLYHTAHSGRFSGLIGETLQQICREAGLACRFHMRPVSRAYRELERGEVQALVTVKFKRFEACCIASDWHYSWRSGLYSKLPPQQIPASLAGIAGDGLIVVRGWQSPYTFFDDLDGAERRGELQLHRANSSTAALRMLSRDRAVYLWGGEEFQWFIGRLQLDGLQFKPLLELPMVLWIAKQETEIAERFNQGYQRLRVKGLLNDRNQLIERLMSQRYQDPP